MSIFEEHLVWAEKYTNLQCMRMRVPAHVRDDCLQAVRLALWKSAARFDPARGIAFKSFFCGRLVNAIRDQLRVECRRISMPRLTLLRTAGKAAPVVISLDAPNELEMYDSRRPRVASFPAKPTGTETQIQDRETILEALSALPQRERAIVVAVFFGTKNTTEIGRDLGISQARISQLFRTAMRRMRKALSVCDVEIPSVSEARRAS